MPWKVTSKYKPDPFSDIPPPKKKYSRLRQPGSEHSPGEGNGCLIILIGFFTIVSLTIQIL